jgi:flagellar motility protein MotE (MotC chaperone)
MKGLPLIFAAKAVVLLALGGVLYSHFQAKAQNQSAAEAGSADSKKEKSAEQIPEIPDQGLTLSRASELRNQLLLIRKEIEQKTEKLNVARQGYERSKSDIENKLKRIEEERRLLEETLQKERKAKEERLSEALEFVAKMEPKKAAPLLEGMDRDLVMQLLRKLPSRQVTKLLEAVSPKKATEFLEYYTRIRSAREYEVFRELGLCEGQGTEEKTNDKSTKDKAGTGQSGQVPTTPTGLGQGASSGTPQAIATASPAAASGSAPAAIPTASVGTTPSSTSPATSASGPSAAPTAVR